MVIVLVAAASAAPVVCDPTEAAGIVEQARIEVSRVPVTHPHLVPGLAMAETQDEALAAALADLCTPGVTVDRGPSWRGPDGAAHVIELARADRDGCELVQRRISISVGIGSPGQPRRYHLLRTPPIDRTPLPGCAGPASWHQRTAINGGDGSVRLFVQVLRRGPDVLASSVEVLEASADGWTRQLLLDPAPQRYIDPAGGGPRLGLGQTRSGETWIVASGCTPRGGQTVWRATEGGWGSAHGREALGLLAREELWRLAGDPGWFLILAQGNEADAPLLAPRLRRLQRRQAAPLHLFRSAAYPQLNPGYLFVAQAPWPTRAEAEAARRPAQRGAYVKRAWAAPASCAP